MQQFQTQNVFILTFLKSLKNGNSQLELYLLNIAFFNTNRKKEALATPGVEQH